MYDKQTTTYVPSGLRDSGITRSRVIGSREIPASDFSGLIGGRAMALMTRADHEALKIWCGLWIKSFAHERSHALRCLHNRPCWCGQNYLHKRVFKSPQTLKAYGTSRQPWSSGWSGQLWIRTCHRCSRSGEPRGCHERTRIWTKWSFGLLLWVSIYQCDCPLWPHLTDIWCRTWIG